MRFGNQDWIFQFVSRACHVWHPLHGGALVIRR
jgi:hypothetical protein